MTAHNETSQKIQAPILDKEEMELLKATFANREDLFKEIRALFLGLEVSEENKTLIKNTFSLPRVLDIFRKRMYPKLSRSTPIGQLQDYWLGVETQVFGQNPDTIRQALESKQRVKEMYEKAFELLLNPDLPRINLVDFNPRNYPSTDLGIELLARNLFIQGVE